MFCSSCGKPLAAGAAQCPSCGAAAPAATAGLYAGFWRRAAAYFVDGLVLLVPSVVLTLAARSSVGLSWLLQLLLGWLYLALLESGPRQATVGKMAFGIKVTDLEGNRISFARATGRYFGMFVSGIILGIGFLMAAFTARKQALHDMMAGCLVVRAESSPEQTRLGGDTMRITGGVWAVIVLLFIFPFFGGILAAIAIPAYQDYTIRAKVAEAIHAAGPASDVPGESRYVSRVSGSKSKGDIEIFLEHTAFPARVIHPGASIRYTSRDGSQWDCSAQGVPPKYLPASCRQ